MIVAEFGMIQMDMVSISYGIDIIWSRVSFTDRIISLRGGYLIRLYGCKNVIPRLVRNHSGVSYLMQSPASCADIINCPPALTRPISQD